MSYLACFSCASVYKSTHIAPNTSTKTYALSTSLPGAQEGEYHVNIQVLWQPHEDEGESARGAGPPRCTWPDAC